MVLSDRRKSARKNALDTALIRFGDVSVACVVRDISESGAALRIGAQSEIPDQFKLVVPRSKVFACRVAWRKGGWVGVSFL
ncbi:hypothetical protein UP10_26745 [Bradyrhizobium sp. LTSPM299]|nr:hypothetical protein UP10_26745 [Bradyrhizobium sp. LTSPM299]